MPPEPDLTEMIFGDVDLTATNASPEAELENARMLAANVPAPARPLRQPFADRPWQEQFQDVAGEVIGTPQYSLVENAGDAALANTSDEMAAGFATSKPGGDAWTRAKMGPPADELGQKPNTYAAGSEQEDIRRTLEAEKNERDERNPLSSTTGNLLGAGAVSAVAPQRLVPQLAAGALQTGTSLMGQGSGGIDERFDQGVEAASESPYMTTAALLAPLGGAAVKKGAQFLEGAARRGANKNTVAAFTTPQQRTALENNLGAGGIDRLGADVRAQGLHKQPWYKFLLPPNAETFYDNAVTARQGAEKALEASESQIIGAGDPKIKYTPVARDLESAADEVMKRADQTAAQKEAGFMRDQAESYRGKTKDMSQRSPEELAQHNDEMAEYEKAMELFRKETDPDPLIQRNVDHRKTVTEPTKPELGEPQGIETGVRPFSEAQADLRYNNKQIDFGRTGGGPDAPMQEQVRRRIGGQLREQIHSGLDDAVGTGQLEAGTVADWKKAKKAYGTAAAVEDPALALMQREYGGTMGLRDMAGASMMSAFGLPGPGAVAASKAMQGRWPGFKANQLERGANALQKVGKDAYANAGMAREALTPMAEAKQNNPDAPKNVVVQEANKSLKDQLMDAMESGSNWFMNLLD